MVRLSLGKIRKKTYEQVDIQDKEDSNGFNHDGGDGNESKSQREDVSNLSRSESGDESDGSDQVGIDMKKRPANGAFFLRYKRRFPSYSLVSERIRGMKTKDRESEKHQMSIKRYVKRGKKYPEKRDFSKTFMKRHVGSKDYIDPAHYPLEQITDAEYGVSYSYTPADHLVAMDPVEEIKNKAKRRQMFILASSIILVLLMFIIGIIAKNITTSNKDLKTLCSLSNVATISGHKQCVEACKNGECCFSLGEDSCYQGSEEECSRYSWCGNIHLQIDGDTDIDDTMLLPARTDIGNICADWSIATSSGYNACRAACSAGHCCFIDTGLDSETSNSLDSGKSCKESHQDICESYSPCLSMEGMENVDTSPEDIVNAVCTADNIQHREGKDECENACQPRSCCFTPKLKSNCRSANQVWCSVFKACEILSNPPDNPSYFDNVGVNEQELHVINSFNSNSVDMTEEENGSIDGVTDTFDSQDVELTKDSITSTNLKSPTKTPTYRPYSANKIDSEELALQGPPKKHVDDVCADPSKTEACFALCADYLCCYEVYYKNTAETTACHPVKVCEKYQSCSKISYNEALIQASIKKSVSATAVSTPPSPLKSTPLTSVSSGKGVEEICSAENLVSPDGVKMCTSMCKNHMCCFGGDCERDPDCKRYQACFIIAGWEDPNSLKGIVQQKNDSKKIEDKRWSSNESHNDSSSQNAFFTNLGEKGKLNNDSTNVTPVATPHSSSVLSTSHSYNGSPGDELKTACIFKENPSELEKSICKDTCAAWDCCWNPNDSERCDSFDCLVAIEVCEFEIDYEDVNCSLDKCCWHPSKSGRCYDFDCVKMVKYNLCKFNK